MSYFTYRLFKGVSLDKLREKVEANLALYEPGTAGREITVALFQGQGCSAIVLHDPNREGWLLTVLGPQLGGVWMDVRHLLYPARELGRS